MSESRSPMPGVAHATFWKRPSDASGSAFRRGVIVGVLATLLVVGSLTPRIVFNRVLCMTWVEPNGTAVCHGHS